MQHTCGQLPAQYTRQRPSSDRAQHRTLGHRPCMVGFSVSNFKKFASRAHQRLAMAGRGGRVGRVATRVLLMVVGVLCAAWAGRGVSAAPPEHVEQDAIAERMLGEGVNQYLHLLEHRGAAGGHEWRAQAATCARILRGAARLAHVIRSPATAQAPALPSGAREQRRQHLGQQAMLFLAMLRELEGSHRQALAAYVSVIASSVALDVNSLANIAKENINALRRRLASPPRPPPPPPPPGAAAWEQRARGERFLAFRFWAGLSNRRQELIGMLGAAKVVLGHASEQAHMHAHIRA